LSFGQLFLQETVHLFIQVREMHIVSQLVSVIVSESSNDPVGVLIAGLVWRLGLFKCNASAIELESKVGRLSFSKFCRFEGWSDLSSSS
jgi:hypothetical protein